MNTSTDNHASSSSLFLTSDELGRMLLDDPTLLQLSTTFNDEPLAMMTLRHFHFITDTIDRLEHVILQHQQEQTSIFDYLLQTPTFQDLIHPIVHEYRRNNPLPHTNSVTPSPTGSNDSSSSSSTTSEVTSYHTAPMRSPTNPIEIDDDDEPNNILIIRCRKCTRTGHDTGNCFFDGPPLCDRCWKYGHYRPTCEEIPVCRWCKQPGHQLPSKYTMAPLYDDTPA